MADVLERDAGFCSGGDDDDMEAEDDIHSPTDASEDSVDVKVQAISLRNKNKRKCAEPRRLDTELPAKKRKISLVLDEKNDTSRGPTTETCNPSPFRPWSSSPVNHRPREEHPRCPPLTNPIHLPFRPEIYYPQARIPIVYLPELPSPPHPSLLAPSPLPRAPVPFYPRDLTGLVPTPYVHPPYPVGHYQEEPLSLVSKKKEVESDSAETEEPTPLFSPALRLEKNSSFKPVGETTKEPEKNTRTWHSPVVDFSQKSAEEVKEKETNVVSRSKNCNGRSHSDKKLKSVSEKISNIKTEENCHQSDSKFRIDHLLSSVKSESGSTSTSTSTTGKPSQSSQQRNYKNMTRERRIEANARERTRVHTISAAFDTLRHAVPAYSHNQKLSKLSVLRIACSYIMTLSRLAGYDYSKDQSEPEVGECVDNVSKTIQTEGKIRKKKED